MKRILNIVLLIGTVFLTSCYLTLYEPRNDDPAVQLDQKYSIHLDSTWTAEQKQTLLKTFVAISPEFNGQSSVWKISTEDLENDIKIESRTGLKLVTIRRDVFPIKGSQQKTSSKKRLYNAVVKFITENGTNRDTIKLILQERSGITVDVPSYMILTRSTTQETDAHYADFENEDLMILISILEEFPRALQKIPHLEYIICRIDDKIRAPGVAWTSSSYIELSQALFKRDFVDDTRRLIAHEKAHFLWSHLFPDQLKQDWIELGGWYEDKGNAEGWSTSKKRAEFVSDYAHEKNPNEDMAESLGFYLVFPDKLRSYSQAKYDFIHERIMLMYGERYMSPDRM